MSRFRCILLAVPDWVLFLQSGIIAGIIQEVVIKEQI